MDKRKQRNDQSIKVGDVFETNQGSSYTIIEYVSSKDITIQFNDDHKHITKTASKEIRNKSIRNPYFKTMFDVGYIGDGVHKSKEGKFSNKSYTAWRNMFVRCYDEEYKKRNPTYVGCEVDERWHNFQVFAEWFTTNSRDDWELDKDILIRGNKIYSPESCRMVPPHINSMLNECNTTRGVLPLGVSMRMTDNGETYRAHVNINNKQYVSGTMYSKEEAFAVYKIEKEKEIKRVANIYRDVIDPEIYEALREYEVYPYGYLSAFEKLPVCEEMADYTEGDFVLEIRRQLMYPKPDWNHIMEIVSFAITVENSTK